MHALKEMKADMMMMRTISKEGIRNPIKSFRNKNVLAKYSNALSQTLATVELHDIHQKFNFLDIDYLRSHS